MPGWHPVVLITLLSSGMLSNSQVRALKIYQYVKLSDKVFSPWVYFTSFSNLQEGMGCLSLEVTHLQSGSSVLLPGLDGSEQGIPHCCRQQLHSGCAADFTLKSLFHVFIYMLFIWSWLPILIPEFLDFEANCAPSQPLLPQADKQECDWK